MSSYSFSHQFYQHWTLAPEPVRAAIVQELTDINTLLQPDTAFDNFIFSEHDLDTHLDNLYHTHDIEQAAAKKIAEEQAQQAAEQQRLEEAKERKEQAKAEKATVLNAQQAETHIETTQRDNVENNSSMTAKTPDDKINNQRNNVNSNKDKVISALQINSISDTVKQSPAKQDVAINIPVNAPKLNQANEALIHSLGMHIDDYLSEQMAQLSEDLKSWLREEISQQLSAHGQTTDNVDNKK